MTCLQHNAKQSKLASWMVYVNNFTSDTARFEFVCRSWNENLSSIVFHVKQFLKNASSRKHLPGLRAAFKFGRRVYFALRRKMRKPPITRVPAILNGPTNRPSWKTDSIYSDIVKRWSTRPWMTSIQVNSKFEWRKWPLKSISTYILMHLCLPSYSVPESWHIFVK